MQTHIHTKKIITNKCILLDGISLSQSAEMCEHNRLIAEKYSSSDTVQCWKLAHLIATSISTATDSLDDEIFLQQIPFPKILLESLQVLKIRLFLDYQIVSISIIFHISGLTILPKKNAIFKLRQCFYVPLADTVLQIPKYHAALA